MCVRAVAVGNVGDEGDEAVGVCVERWDDVMRRYECGCMSFGLKLLCVKCVCFVFIAGTGGSRRAALRQGIVRRAG